MPGSNTSVTSDTIYVRSGHPGRYVITRIGGGKVYLKQVSPKGRRFGGACMTVADFEAAFDEALTPLARARLRTSVLQAIHEGREIDRADRRVRAALDFLRRERMVTADYTTTTRKGATLMERITSQ